MLLTSSSSKTMIKDNFVRYWPIPVLTLFTYILVGIFPIILSYRSFNNVSAYAARFISGTGFAPNFILTVTCVIASAAVFGYLHDPVSSTAIHAMPAGRKKLFASAAFSGWLFVVIPAVIMAFLMLTMRGATLEPDFDPTASEVTSWASYAGNAKEVFTFGHSLLFIFSTIVTASATFAICCLSAVISGRKVIHVLLSMFLITVPVVLFAQVESILSMFLYGFAKFDINYSWLSALAWSMSRDNFEIDLPFAVLYLIFAAVLLICSYFIYKAVRLERVGNASTFPVVADALCVVLTFIGGLAVAMVMVSLTENKGSESLKFILISIVASAVVYLIMRMIADSTPAVFNLTTLKKSLVYYAILAVFLAFAVGDVTHYQTRVPDASEVESVTFTANFPEEAIGTYDYKDEGMIGAVIDLQNAMIETKDINYGYADVAYDTKIVWHLKNGKTMMRYYEERFGQDFRKVEDAAVRIYDQKTFRTNILASIDNVAADLKAVRAYGNDDFDDNTGEQRMTYIKKEDWSGLIKAMKKDCAGRTFEQARTDTWAVVIELVSNVSEDEMGNYYPEGINRGFTLKYNDENTINYLIEKGYYDKMNVVL